MAKEATELYGQSKEPQIECSICHGTCDPHTYYVFSKKKRMGLCKICEEAIEHLEVNAGKDSEISW
jgi:hypothetical protein